ncbi:hypothetical protein FYK55_21560 [Roseiconus nitratireducens]|uniref:Uncharacterized protein n=1 Tax=Roseiconus nitratireducens TaxID=2605748 RepID=A0A5M6D4V3_9BACT|nr:hypothetical protein [Roseiconus nitratireducens]KAA5540225.1 hypothetical protein FYK55_21560 [Roseiconus nitratireducens]
MRLYFEGCDIQTAESESLTTSAIGFRHLESYVLASNQCVRDLFQERARSLGTEHCQRLSCIDADRALASKFTFASIAQLFTFTPYGKMLVLETTTGV